MLSAPIGVLACAMTCRSSSSAVRYSIWSVTLPPFTLRYGVSTKPNALTRPYEESEPIRPMFGPSGVSIGHIRP